MPAESELNEQITDAYHAVMRDGTVAAIGREAIKDVRSTFMEFFFGKGERGSEPGTPLTPLFYDLVQARKSHGGEHGPPQHKGSTMDDMPSPSQVIENPQAYLPQEQGQSQSMAMESADRGYGSPIESPSPSQVIDNPQAYQPEMGNSHEHSHGHGR